MPKTPVTEHEASLIMGRNFFGVDQGIDHLHSIPDERNIGLLAKIPFSRELLQSCSKTHMLVAVPPVSIMDMKDMIGSPVLNFEFCTESDSAPFLLDKDSASWQLILKWCIPWSLGTTHNEQLRLAGAVEKIPVARDLMYALAVNTILHPDEKFTDPLFMRCKGITNYPREVAIVGGDSSGLRASHDGGMARIPYVGGAQCELPDLVS
jgi:hypothetical protein